MINLLKVLKDNFFYFIKIYLSRYSINKYNDYLLDFVFYKIILLSKIQIMNDK